ncbi:MAG: hypothetical protein M4579_001139 [Chaenotheca gracillima]|nr:MAG: hypothetical protein M4579_001139 [Chaenotheca gracillima]
MGKLDQSLDEIVSTQRSTARRGARGGRRSSGPGKAAVAAVVAPVGGIKKNTRSGRPANKANVPTGPAAGTGNSKIIVSNLPSDVKEDQVKSPSRGLMLAWPKLDAECPEVEQMSTSCFYQGAYQLLPGQQGCHLLVQTMVTGSAWREKRKMVGRSRNSSDDASEVHVSECSTCYHHQQKRYDDENGITRLFVQKRHRRIPVFERTTIFYTQTPRSVRTNGTTHCHLNVDNLNITEMTTTNSILPLFGKPGPIYLFKGRPSPLDLSISLFEVTNILTLTARSLTAQAGSHYIEEYFSKTVGPVKKALLTYGPNGVSRGVATIIFSRPSAADKALKELNGLLVDGRAIKVEVVLDASRAPAPGPAKTLSERVAQPKPQPKPANATKASANGANSKTARGKGRGRNPRRKPKSREELDAEMDDYMDTGSGAAPAAGGAEATGAAQPVATNGTVDTGMEDEISVSKTTNTE